MIILIDAWKDYKLNGLVEPDSVTKETMKYRDDTNIYQLFINDKIEKNNNNFTKWTTLCHIL